MKYLLGMLSFTHGKSCVMTVFSREKCFIRDGPVDKDIVYGLYIYLGVRVHKTAHITQDPLRSCKFLCEVHSRKLTFR